MLVPRSWPAPPAPIQGDPRKAPQVPNPGYPTAAVVVPHQGEGRGVDRRAANLHADTNGFRLFGVWTQLRWRHLIASEETARIQVLSLPANTQHFGPIWNEQAAGRGRHPYPALNMRTINPSAVTEEDVLALARKRAAARRR